MKQLLISFVFIFLFSALHAQKGKRIYISKNSDNGSLINSAAGINPGDTIVVRASLNPWSYIYCGGVIGTAEKPIVIINEGQVEMTAGFDIESCRYFKITGSGDKEKYGFRIMHSRGVALVIHGKSAYIEAERFYAEDCAFGCWIKNEANCDTSVNNWVLNYISVHDFEMRNIKIEGFYAGSTDANNTSRPKDCGGVQYYYKPSKLGNIKIYNGIIDGTGRPAIMLSNAQIGMSEIYNNVITNVGREYNDQQGTGISLGLYTRAFIHHNNIKNTYTWGIASLGGSGLIRIENNKIENSGFIDGKKLNWPQNIVIDTRLTQPADTTKFIVINNQVSNPGKDVKSIEIWKSADTYSNSNLICGNTTNGKPASVVVSPGITWLKCGIFQKNPVTNDSTFLLLIIGGVILLMITAFLIYKKLLQKRRGKSQTFAI